MGKLSMYWILLKPSNLVINTLQNQYFLAFHDCQKWKLLLWYSYDIYHSVGPFEFLVFHLIFVYLTLTKIMHLFEVRGIHLNVKHGYVLKCAWNIVWFFINC
jgi:hypothetical protein